MRLTHPLSAHLAQTAALWQKACEPIAEWLARSFDNASSAAPVRAALMPRPATVSRAGLEAQPLMGRMIPTLAPPLPGFIAARGHRSSASSVLKRRAGVRDEPVPATCWECGRALSAESRTFCSDECAENYRRAMAKRRTAVEGATRAARERHQDATIMGQQATEMLAASDRRALRQWYTEVLQPRLSRMHPSEIAVRAAMGRSYAYYIAAGTRIPHPRYYPNLAALAGVELPKKFAAALSATVLIESVTL